MDGSMLFESLATTAVDVTKQYNLDNRRRFTVLYDRYYPLTWLSTAEEDRKYQST